MKVLEDIYFETIHPPRVSDTPKHLKITLIINISKYFNISNLLIKKVNFKSC